jgi:hypothetical protein
MLTFMKIDDSLLMSFNEIFPHVSRSVLYNIVTVLFPKMKVSGWQMDGNQ